MQAAAVEVVCVLGLQDVEGVSQQLNDLTFEKNLLFMTGFVNSFKRNPEPYLLCTLVIFIVYSFSCVLLIYGALKLSVWLVVPFVGLEMVRLCATLALLVAAMLVLKKNSMDLGPLMGGSTGGGFFMLIMLYMWMCPLSLAQELFRRRRATARAMAWARANRANGFNDVSLERVALEAKLATRIAPYPYTTTYPTFRGYPAYME